MTLRDVPFHHVTPGVTASPLVRTVGVVSLTDTTPSAPRDRARPPRPSSKPNGQWKIDGPAPLNGNEEWKQVDDGLSVRERIENVYSKSGFKSIDPTDLHGRFRVWGLYTQRKPGIDGGRTATLTPEELEVEYFMLRVRIDGGQLTTDQLRVIAGISTVAPSGFGFCQVPEASMTVRARSVRSLPSEVWTRRTKGLVSRSWLATLSMSRREIAITFASVSMADARPATLLKGSR